MKWPRLAAHSRASVADALATVTSALSRAAPEPPWAADLRTALYKYAFNPAHAARADQQAARTLTCAQNASLPLTRLADPLVLRRAMDALTLRLDGTREVIAAALAVAAAIELAYTLFTPGPDEALDPLMLGLASGILILVTRDELRPVWQFAGVLLGVLALGGLFLIRRHLLGDERE